MSLPVRWTTFAAALCLVPFAQHAGAGVLLKEDPSQTFLAPADPGEEEGYVMNSDWLWNPQSASYTTYKYRLLSATAAPTALSRLTGGPAAGGGVPRLIQAGPKRNAIAGNMAGLGGGGFFGGNLGGGGKLPFPMPSASPPPGSNLPGPGSFVLPKNSIQSPDSDPSIPRDQQNEPLALQTPEPASCLIWLGVALAGSTGAMLSRRRRLRAAI